MAREEPKSLRSTLIGITCRCGARITASRQHAGQMVPCPKCGELNGVPSDEIPALLNPQVKKAVVSPPQRRRRIAPILISAGVTIALFAVAAIVFYFFVATSSNRRSSSEVKRLQQEAAILKTAKEWLASGLIHQGEAIEQSLQDGIANGTLSNKTAAQELLRRVSTRRTALELEDLPRQAEDWISNGDLKKAAQLLHRYLSDGNAKNKEEAQSLLDELELATSNAHAIDILKAMSDDEFTRFCEVKQYSDGSISHPELIKVQSEVLTRNLQAAIALRAKSSNAIRSDNLADTTQPEAEKIEEAVVEFQSLVATPDQYAGEQLLIENVVLHGDLRGDAANNLYAVAVSDLNGSKLDNVFDWGLTFVFEEPFGSALSELLRQGDQVSCNLHAEVDYLTHPTFGRVSIAMIEQIDILSATGGIEAVYKHDDLEKLKQLVKSSASTSTKDPLSNGPVPSVETIDDQYFPAVIRAASDGDTVTARTESGRIHRFRLHGTDAPEDDQYFDKESKKILELLAKDKQAFIKILGTDLSGERVGVVYLHQDGGPEDQPLPGQMSLARQMLVAGAAMYDRTLEGRDEKEFVFYEDQAKKAKLGVWSFPDGDPTPPWEWRKMELQERAQRVQNKYARRAERESRKAAVAAQRAAYVTANNPFIKK